jgi:hypothetical protein
VHLFQALALKNNNEYQKADGRRFESRGPLIFLRIFLPEILQLATINLWQTI